MRPFLALGGGVVHVDHDGLADPELLPQDPLGERVLHQLLDGPPQRAGPQLGVVALLGQQVAGGRGQLDGQPLGLQLHRGAGQHEVDDLDDLLAGELVEDDHLVDAVEELGAEVGLERLVHLGLHALVGDGLGGLGEAHRGLAQVGRPQVRGHDQHGVLEVHRAALGVGQPAVLEDLQQGVEHVGVRLLHLVEQHHREGLAAHGLGELPSLLVADVARGRAHQAADGVLLHVLAHVELDQGVLVVEEELGQGLGQLGLPDAGGAEEDERAAGPLGVLQAGPRPPDGPREGLQGLLLADDPLVQLVLHAQELGRLLLGEPVHRDARPVGQDLGDDLLVHHVEEVDALGPPLGLLGLLATEALGLLLGQLLRLLEGAALDGRLLVGAQSGDLLVELLVARRGGHPPDPQPAAGLVDQVDGLVGQEAVGQVAVGQVGRRHQCLVGDGDRVVRLVAVAQALQDVDGQRHRRLLHLHRLEAPLQGGVLLEVLAVLVQGGGADGLQLAAGQHGLEDRGGVDGALGGAGAHQGVQLVDEQDDVAAGADLLQHLLQALLEVAPVPAAGHQGPQVEGVELLAGQGVGHVVGHDALGQSLDDGRLAHAGLADQDRVVLGAARQDLHDALDLLGPADDRVELPVARQLGEVAAELVEHRRPRRGVRRRGAGAGPHRLLALVARHQLDDLLAHAPQVGAEADQHLGRHALALAHQAEQHVLGADVAVPELQRLAQGQLEDLLGTGGEGGRAARRAAGHADGLLDLLPHGLERDAQRLERLGRHALTLVDQAQQDVLGADEAVVQQARLFLRQHQHSSCPVGEAFEHRAASANRSSLDCQCSGPTSHRHRASGPGRGWAQVSLAAPVAYRRGR